MQRSLCFMILLASLFPVPGRVEIFRCVATNGELTFSQTPCPDSKVAVHKSVTTSNEADACEYAHRFALATAQEMRAGTSSSTVFDRYGGLSALSRGSVSLISYVYQYRTSHDVSADRVAALSVAKCRARSFGDVGCNQLPAAFTSRLGGCEPGETGAPAALPFVSWATKQSYVEPRASRVSQQAEHREARAREEARRAGCKDRIRGQLDRINSQMRSGYTGPRGETLRDRRRNLEAKLREC